MTREDLPLNPFHAFPFFTSVSRQAAISSSSSSTSNHPAMQPQPLNPLNLPPTSSSSSSVYHSHVNHASIHSPSSFQISSSSSSRLSASSYYLSSHMHPFMHSIPFIQSLIPHSSFHAFHSRDGYMHIYMHTNIHTYEWPCPLLTQNKTLPYHT